MRRRSEACVSRIEPPGAAFFTAMHDPVATVAFGVFGTIVLLITIASLREAAAMKRWPIARGRVVSSKVEEYRDSAGSSGTFAGSRVRMTLYRPVVVYEYEVDGKRLRGERITQSPGMNRAVPDFAAAIIQRYAAGTEVDVHYDAKRPSDSVLEPRVPPSWIFALVIGLGLLTLAAFSQFG